MGVMKGKGEEGVMWGARNHVLLLQDIHNE